MEQPLVTAVTHSTGEARVTLQGVPDTPGAAGRDRDRAGRRQRQRGHDHPERAAHRRPPGGHVVHRPARRPARRAARRSSRSRTSSASATSSQTRRMGKVSIVGAGMKSPPRRRRQGLHRPGRAGVNIEMISTSPDQDLLRRARGPRRRTPCARCTPPSSSGRRRGPPGGRGGSARDAERRGPSRRRRGRHGPGRLDDARRAARRSFADRRGRAVRLRALGGPRAARRLVVQPLATTRSRASTSRCSPPAVERQRGVGAALRRRGRRRRRQLLALAHAGRRAARRVRGQPGGARRPPRDRRQPELHDHADGRGARAAAGRGRHRAARDLDLPGGLGHRQGAPWTSCLAQSRCSRATGGRPPAPPSTPHQIAFNVAPAGRDLQAPATTTRRGAQVHERDAQDPRRGGHRRVARPARASRCPRALRVRQRPDARRRCRRRSARALLRAAPGRDGHRRPGAGLYPTGARRRRPRRRAGGADPARPRRTSAASTSGSSATTCARAPPRTRSSWPSS